MSDFKEKLNIFTKENIEKLTMGQNANEHWFK